MSELLTSSVIPAPPPRVPFVILDLASHPSVLKWIYEEIEAQNPASWTPLLLGTEYQERWQVGPALVDLREVPGAQQDLIRKYKDGLPGVFLEHQREQLEDLAVWLQQFLFVSRETQLSLMRFYDPRVFGSFLSVLDQQQNALFVPPGASWYWQSGMDWRVASSDSIANDLVDPAFSCWNFRYSQVDEFTADRRCLFVGALTEKYGRFVQADGPEKYVSDVVMLGEALGLDSKADIEKVLRLLIQRKDRPEAPFYYSLVERTDLTAYQKLEAIEDGKR